MVGNRFIYTETLVDCPSVIKLKEFIDFVYQKGFSDCGTLLMNKKDG